MLVPMQTGVVPLILPGMAGTVFAMSPNTNGELPPHELFAVTVRLPLLLPAVTVITFVVEEPDQPEGSDHVYEEAPITDVAVNVVVAPVQTDDVPLMLVTGAGGNFI